MANTCQTWIAGARPRTLPAALAPVLAGSAIAIHAGHAQPLLAVLALLVALLLQIGVNYANDYSDGIRGTDHNRVGPLRLVASKSATPQQVKTAAFGCFSAAAIIGLMIVILTHLWWLIAVGAACILAAWYYTGGKHPYGYLGLGELFVFIFFGLVAVCGTTLIQIGTIPVVAIWLSVAIGCLAAALLVANNLRDIPTDIAAGKRTLATRLGDRRTRIFYLGLLAASALAIVASAAQTSWWVLLALTFLLVIAKPALAIAQGAVGVALIPALKWTGIAELVCALGVFCGVIIPLTAR